MNDRTTEVARFNQSFDLTIDEIINQIAGQKSWESKYRQLMLLGKKLPMISLNWRTDENQVQGCESNVWLIHEWSNDRLQLAVSSDAKIVKGLVCLVFVAFNNKSAQEILSFDIEEYFDKLALFHQLSPSRTNGVHAIITTILNLAKEKQVLS